MAAASNISLCCQSTSAAGLISLLVESEWSLRIHALKKLNEVVDRFWPEIADSLSEIENLYEDESFPERRLAALLISKVYYHLEEYDDALRYALGVGSLFDIAERSQYTRIIVAKCIDEYVKQRTEMYDKETREAELKQRASISMGEGSVSTRSAAKMEEVSGIDPRLESIVERILDMCIHGGDERQAMGIAFDARRLDKVKEIILHSSGLLSILEYCLHNAHTLIGTKRFRGEVFSLLSNIYRTLPADIFEGEYPNYCKCLYYEKDFEETAKILSNLIAKGGDSVLVAYQIAFDLVDFEDQAFLKSVLHHPFLTLLPSTEVTFIDVDASPLEAALPPVVNCVESPETHESTMPSLQADDATLPSLSEEEKATLANLRYILTGEASIKLRLQFLHRNNKSDLFLLETYKTSVDLRNSLTHHAVIIAHGLMEAGTTNDIFLRYNLEWLGKATNWAKFSATASLGVLNKGHIKRSLTLLEKYLPVDVCGANPYSEGGAFYALGLIHANHSDPSIREYLLQRLRLANGYEILQHGACLGLGLLCMGQQDSELYEELKLVLLHDSAIAGEAAAYAMGLTMLGSASECAITDLLGYAQETLHEKIIRACSVALALIMYRREEEAEPLILQMISDKDAIIRYGAMFTIAMAYCGTAQSAAMKRLLHISVSDVSVDVRRAAVIALGFVLCNVPEQVPKILNLLSESYNAHVRYAAALAVGISSAGTAEQEAVNLLITMTTDSSDFVRQGALIGLGLVMQQATDAMTGKTRSVRNIIERIIGDRTEDVMTRFGAVIAAGLIDSGGRNCRASFFSKSGMLRPAAAVGFCLFTQLWYWFPLIHGISLAFQPTALIGLTKDLKMPLEFSVKCTTKPDLFAYPPNISREKKETKKGIHTAVLSVAAKAHKLKYKKLSERIPSPSVTKPLADVEMKSADKTHDEAASVASDMPSMRGVEISSTAATAGGQSSRMSHTGSTADSADYSTLAASDEVTEFIPPSNETGAAPYTQETTKAVRLFENPQNLTPVIKIGGEKKETPATEIPAVKEKEEVVSECILSNPCRVLPQQERFIEFIPANRYIPIYNNRKSGFLLLKNTQPNLPEQFVETKEKEEKEAEPPEIFEWFG